MVNVKEKAMVMPIINLTPAVELTPTPAPQAADRPQGPEAPTVTVSFREAREVGCSHGITYLDLAFDVCVADPAGEVRGVVTRRIGINNAAFAQELDRAVPTTFIEGTNRSRDSIKRLRELAGIPHKGNFV